MNIRIDDDVPLPQPDKPDTWVTGKPAAKSGLEGWQSAIRSLTPVDPDDVDPPTCPVCDFGHYFGHCSQCGHTDKPKPKPEPVEYGKRYPAETTYDAKGIPTVDCYLVGGPLNGRHGPIVGTAQVVELDIYAADGSVSSVELYELGDRKELGCRYHKGTKP
ncbi:head-to-tail connector protein [Xanthomonas phage Langgrundblatt2]|uniref:Head-to-tail connector protein n=1 Tax=Xanthomonas phage Langgrundblatt2 TaxID=2939129 RepID=A0A9E7J540_9CAUD|nr:head-to-tail connector protein [Xanthomonas phage Langgrundblatt2]URA06837.1 head-to-tail connector protein [Xanthomonas phage Langgrundblatt2]